MVVLTAVMTLLILTQIGVRMMRVSAPWTVEVIQVVFMWLGLIGAAVAVKTVSHVQVDLVSHWLSPRRALAIQLFAMGATVAVAAVLLVEGAQSALRGTRQTLAITGWPVAVSDSALPVSALLILVYAGMRVWATVQAGAAPVAPPPHADQPPEESIKPGAIPE